MPRKNAQTSKPLFRSCINDFQKSAFGLPACSYDLFYTMWCPLDLKPQEIVCSNSEMHSVFSTSEDATAFATWLEDANEKARKSFLSMAG